MEEDLLLTDEIYNEIINRLSKKNIRISNLPENYPNKDDILNDVHDSDKTDRETYKILKYYLNLTLAAYYIYKLKPTIKSRLLDELNYENDEDINNALNQFIIEKNSLDTMDEAYQYVNDIVEEIVNNTIEDIENRVMQNIEELYSNSNLENSIVKFLNYNDIYDYMHNLDTVNIDEVVEYYTNILTNAFYIYNNLNRLEIKIQNKLRSRNQLMYYNRENLRNIIDNFIIDSLNDRQINPDVELKRILRRIENLYYEHVREEIESETAISPEILSRIDQLNEQERQDILERASRNVGDLSQLSDTIPILYQQISYIINYIHLCRDTRGTKQNLVNIATILQIPITLDMTKEMICDIIRQYLTDYNTTINTNGLSSDSNTLPYDCLEDTDLNGNKWITNITDEDLLDQENRNSIIQKNDIYQYGDILPDNKKHCTSNDVLKGQFASLDFNDPFTRIPFKDIKTNSGISVVMDYILRNAFKHHI